MARLPAVRRLEGLGHFGEGDRLLLLSSAIPARAVPDRRGVDMSCRPCVCGFAALVTALPAWSATPVINESPDYRIAFASFAPLNTDLFIADADGNNARPFLPHYDLDSNASFSHDGRWIVFTSRRNGSSDIYRAHPDGTALETLVDDAAFDDQA